ncbi:hypothetical protein D9M71_285900 [compost metagenome]
MGQGQLQRRFQAIGGLLPGLLLFVRDRVVHQQLFLDDVVGGKRPFAAPLPKALLEADLGLLRLGQVIVHLRGAEADEVVDPILAG